MTDSAMTDTSVRDFYEVLGVPRDADQQAIKRAYRRLALKHHPDRSDDPAATQRFRQVSEAYAVLSDPDQRAAYDARGTAGRHDFDDFDEFDDFRGGSADDLWSGIDVDDVFGGLFGGLFGGPGTGGARGRRTRRGPSAGGQAGADITVRLEIPLSTVLTGGRQRVTIRRPGRCDACGGSGARAGTSPHTCPTCGGTGKLVTTSGRGNVSVRQIHGCDACEGRGIVIDEPCPECAGHGEVRRRHTLTVTIPAGIEDGTALRLVGKGMPGPRGGAPGDAYVVIQVAPHERFVRQGADLECREPIDVVDAVLGTTRVIPGVDGDITLVVPPGIQPGTVLRIPGRGLPRFGEPGRGELRVVVDVRVPEHLSDRQRRLYQQLRTPAAPVREPRPTATKKTKTAKTAKKRPA